MNTALLFTDCQHKNVELQRKIAQVLPCRVAPLHDVPVEKVQAGIVVSDVALDSPVTIEMLRLTLERYRKKQVPLLFILRDVSQQSIKRALDLGASKVLDAACPQHTLLATLSRLLCAESMSPSPAAARTALSSLPSHVADTSAVLRTMMETARHHEIIAPDSITAGADSVLDAIRSNSVRSWLEVVWTYDDVTYQHCLLVAGLAASFGLELGFSRDDCRRLTGAALLHDVGKACTPQGCPEQARPVDRRRDENHADAFRDRCRPVDTSAAFRRGHDLRGAAPS